MNQDMINNLKSQLAGGVQVVCAPQLFPTPKHIAKKMIGFLNIQKGDRILEPSAGTGRLIEAVYSVVNQDDVSIDAVEINYKLRNDIEEKYSNVLVSQSDFLEWYPPSGLGYDCIAMNPPFKNGDDIKHIKHALKFLNDGGILVALCANGSRQQAQLMDLCDHWEALPEGTFKEQGTMVNAALLVIKN